MTGALCLVFFASGVAGLLFETLWFRQAGLALGNSVWASALVTASFMGGLAIGNALAARWGSRLRRPLLAYALLELVVALVGVALVLGFPTLTSTLAPLLGWVGNQALLNSLRLVSAFVILLLPSSAMGATLPILVRSLSSSRSSFGPALGLLYGWNTLGAVAGALVGELLLIEALGVRGTAFAAAGLDVLAAGAAALLSRRWRPRSIPTAVVAEQRLVNRGPALRVCAAAALTGFLLLALEVVWFRFLLLFIPGTSLTFAVVLAVVLIGIAGGGLLASLWLRLSPTAYSGASLVALAAGIALTTCYAAFPDALAPHGSRFVAAPLAIILVSLRLMFPVCLISGLIFTLLGQALRTSVGEDALTTGLLTLANTVGAMLGALFAGFLLLPYLGMERSFFVLACGYLGVALLIPCPTNGRHQRLARLTAFGLCLVVVALFPFGLMSRRYLPIVAARWSGDGSRIAVVKEGLTETVVLFRRDFLGHPMRYRLVTNGIGMSATGSPALRYMSLFVAFPVAVHPGPRTALVICNGLGTTARALTETPELTSIDVVDISRDVLSMSAVVFPEPGANPLGDPRVRTHVEDGRFFLQTTRATYDIITAEPPPPKSAGTVNLYTREYFELLHGRLADGGFATYWLPVFHMTAPEARSIVRAFCDVFEDCSLWTGRGLEWMLVGSRNARGPVDEERFTRQWRHPVAGGRLRAAGLELPEQLGALFLADARQLRQLTVADAPLEDNHPYRLWARRPTGVLDPWYLELMDSTRARDRFARSEPLRKLWPPGLRDPTLGAFAAQGLLNRFFLARGTAMTLADLEELLTGTDLSTPVVWFLGSSAEEQEIAAREAARGRQEPLLDELFGVAAFSRRDYLGAERHLARAEPHASHADRLRQWRILALGLAGDQAGAARLFEDASRSGNRPGTDGPGWQWLARHFGLP